MHVVIVFVEVTRIAFASLAQFVSTLSLCYVKIVHMKNVFNKNNFWFYIALCIGVIGIILGSFFDLQISQAICNMESPVGQFVETYGIFFIFIPFTFGAVALFKALIHHEKIAFKILAVAILVVAYGGIFYACYNTIHYKPHTWRYEISTPVALIISGVLPLVLGGIAFPLVRNSDNKQLIRTGLLLTLSFVVSLALIEGLKLLNCRPRYRFLISDELNTEGVAFRNWWEFRPFSVTSGDFYKSWPSGHTGYTSTLLTLPFITRLLKKENKVLKYGLLCFGFAYLIFVALFRIIYGAHFLSDVSSGLVICLIPQIVFQYIFAGPHAKKI